MKSNIQLIQSGLPLVDKAWGGFYKGGSYLLIGPRKSGRTLVGLQSALQAAKQKEICLYFTTMRPKDLMIHAASIDFDLQYYMNQNLIIVVRVAPPTESQDSRNPDENLIEYLQDIITVVNQCAPNRIIFDELTHYIGFNNLDLLKNSFLQTLETIEEKDIISLFIIGEPATSDAQNIVDILAQQVTATIYLQKRSLVGDNKLQGGKITITPNVGHTEGQFSSNYFIEPYKGIVADYRPPVTNSPVQPGPEMTPRVTKSTGSKYLSISNFSMPADAYSFSNFYDYNDFILILNNQIALYKSTGQVFNVVSFRLDQAAIENGLLTINQLQNAVRLATDKKDKICVIENKVLVLIVRSDHKSANELISKLQLNLPNNSPEYIKTVLQYISVLSIEIDERIENAESLMNYIAGEDNQIRNNSGNSNNLIY